MNNKIPFRNRKVEIYVGEDHMGNVVYRYVIAKHALLYNPLVGRRYWYWDGDKIPDSVMAYLMPSEREQVRRILQNGNPVKEHI